MNKIAVVALAVLAAGCASAPRRPAARTAVVEGWAALDGSSRAAARRRAVADAQRRAVEEAAGVEVAAVSAVDDAGRVSERVSTAGRGVVRDYKVLEERVEGGMLAVRVRALVERPEPGAPRRPGWIPGTGPSAKVTAGAGALDEAARGAFDRAWTSFGGESAEDGADLAVRLRAEESPVDEPRVRPFVSVRVRLSASFSRPGGGAVWAASRESAALGADACQARERALKAAAEALAQAAAEDMPARLWLASAAARRVP